MHRLLRIVAVLLVASCFVGAAFADDVRDELDVIPGVVPGLIDPPNACRFAPRCIARVENELEICTQQAPELIQITPTHQARCFLYSEESADE